MSRHVTETVTLQTYSLELIGPAKPPGIALTPRSIEAVEEDLNDSLKDTPYSVRIREWDEEETPNV